MSLYHWAYTKGGVGKTTLACNHAVWLTVRRGRRVCLVGADKQAHVQQWHSWRAQQPPGLIPIEVVTLLEGNKMTAPLRRLAEKYDDLVIDTGGYDSQELRSCLNTVDVAITPIKPRAAALASLPDMQQALDHARGYNPELVSLCFLNEAPTNPKEQGDVPDALGLAREYDAFTVIDELLHNSKLYDSAWRLGRAVLEHKGAEKPVEEFERLALVIEQAAAAKQAAGAAQ